jgi:hypothetical protein
MNRSRRKGFADGVRNVATKPNREQGKPESAPESAVVRHAPQDTPEEALWWQ